MTQLKAGARLKSTACDGEVMVVTAPAEGVSLTCGGAPMLADATGADRVAVDPEHSVGIRIGKRYVTEDGQLEVLCVKAGEGGLAADGVLLLQKDTKQLPKTD